MKARLKGMINGMSRDDEGSGWVVVTIKAKGVVENSRSPDAKQVEYSGTLAMRALLANELKFGQELFITLSTEEDA
jgi:hypothetical protein